ncbi:MAG TPA: hypothetical protein VF384_09060 [Planctomycetota bacterium]
MPELGIVAPGHRRARVLDGREHLVEEREFLGRAAAPVQPDRIEVAARATIHARRERAQNDRLVAQNEAQYHDLTRPRRLTGLESDPGTRDVAHGTERLIAGMPPCGLEGCDGHNANSFSPATIAIVAHRQGDRQISWSI